MIGRPKKSPRVRVQIIFEREQAKRLRTFAKGRDMELSQVARAAVDRYINMEECAAYDAIHK